MTDPTPSQDEINLSIRELLDYLWSAFATEDDDARRRAIETWDAVHGEQLSHIHILPPSQVDTSDVEALIARIKLGYSFVAWQLVEFMSEQTGRPLADLMAEFEQRIAIRPE